MTILESLTTWAAGVVVPPRRMPPRNPIGGLVNPRNSVLLALVAALAIGGGRKWLAGWRARRAVERLAEPDPTVEDVLAAADHGRAPLIDLFRLLATARTPEVRRAAGRSLAKLWHQDQLIAEEEKAVIARGYSATWRARRRYPRAMTSPIPVGVDYGVPFLEDAPGEVGPKNLLWSHRVVGADRASLEEYSPWRAGPGSVSFSIMPGDYASNGPHRLVLHARAKTAGLTSDWTLDLPQVPLSFDLDPLLAADALLGSADDARAAAFAGSLGLEVEGTSTLPLDGEFALRGPINLVFRPGLPCDLAHRAALELEGVAATWPAGVVVVGDQRGPHCSDDRTVIPLAPVGELPAGLVDRPGERRLRLVLTPDPDLGWGDPSVRSIWPSMILTPWAVVRVIRR